MGFFDALTGDSAKEAAEENSGRLRQLRNEGSAIYDNTFQGSNQALQDAKADFLPLDALASKYGKGSDMLLNALGLNGPGGNAAATAAFQTGPGYEFSVNQSLDALDRRAASRGMLASGNNTLDTLSTVNGLANQEYGNWRNGLAGLVAPELSATGAAATGRAVTDTGRAANWNAHGTNLVNLASGTTNGLNQQATQAANAEMQASGNLLNLGQNLLKMGTGFLG